MNGSNHDTLLVAIVWAIALVALVAALATGGHRRSGTAADTAQALPEAYADTATDDDVAGEFARLVAPLDEPVYDHEREGL